MEDPSDPTPSEATHLEDLPETNGSAMTEDADRVNNDAATTEYDAATTEDDAATPEYQGENVNGTTQPDEASNNAVVTRDLKSNVLARLKSTDKSKDSMFDTFFNTRKQYGTDNR